MPDIRDNFDGLLDVAKVETWLTANIPQLGDAPLQVEVLAGGTANAVFRVSRGGAPMVLRRPPKAPIRARTRLGLRISNAECFIRARTAETVSAKGEPACSPIHLSNTKGSVRKRS